MADTHISFWAQGLAEQLQGTEILLERESLMPPLSSKDQFTGWAAYTQHIPKRVGLGSSSWQVWGWGGGRGCPLGHEGSTYSQVGLEVLVSHEISPERGGAAEARAPALS